MTRVRCGNILALGVFAVALAVAGCGGSSGTDNVLPTPSPLFSPTPPPLAHMYVGYTNGSNVTIAQYRLPLSSGSAPSALFPQPNGNAVFAVDPASGRLATITTSTLAIYAQPLLPASAPAVTIPAGPATFTNAQACAFDSWGNLWIETAFDVREFTAPFVSYETPAIVTSIPASGGAMEFGPDATMYLVSGGVSGRTLTLAPVLPPPTIPPSAPVPPVYTRPAKTLSLVPNPQSPFAFDQNGDAIATYQVVVVSTPVPSPVPQATSGIGVFPFPLNALTIPSVVLPAPNKDPVTSFTASGSDATYLNQGAGANFYIGDNLDGSLYTYRLPIAPSQAPAIRLPCPAGIANCRFPTAPQAFQFGP